MGLMNKEEEDLLGNAYKSYYNKTKDLTLETLNVSFQQIHLYGNITGAISDTKFMSYTQEQFIEKIKANDEFANKWAVTIVERELTSDEWVELMIKKHNMILEGGDDSLPTKLITITYNDKTIESYGN